jgi:hypothetical protein
MERFTVKNSINCVLAPLEALIGARSAGRGL